MIAIRPAPIRLYAMLLAVYANVNPVLPVHDVTSVMRHILAIQIVKVRESEKLNRLLSLIEDCGCSTVGSINAECDRKTGDCACLTNFTGRACDRCATGYVCIWYFIIYYLF